MYKVDHISLNWVFILDGVGFRIWIGRCRCWCIWEIGGLILCSLLRRIGRIGWGMYSGLCRLGKFFPCFGYYCCSSLRLYCSRALFLLFSAPHGYSNANSSFFQSSWSKNLHRNPYFSYLPIWSSMLIFTLMPSKF